MYGEARHHEILSKSITCDGVWFDYVRNDPNVRILVNGKARHIYRWTGDASPDGAYWKQRLDDEEVDASYPWIPEKCRSLANARACMGTTKHAGKKFSPIDRQDEEIVLPMLNGYIKVRIEGDRRQGRKARFEWVPAFRDAERTYAIPVRIEQPHGTEYTPADDLTGTRFWDDYLTRSLSEDEAQYLQCFFGYSLLEHNNEQVGLFMHGEGGEGKSTLVNLCGRLHRKTVPVSMRKLGDFGLATASTASLIFVDDAPATWDNADVMKSVLSAGLMAMDVKHSDAIEGRVFAKMVVCGNEVPYVNDASTGWQRRWMLARWSRKVERDGTLEGHIVKHELRAVLDWMLVGLKRYIEHGLPTMAEAPKSSQALFEELVSANNTAAAWAIHSGARVDPAVQTDKKAIYDAYRAWGLEMDKNPKAMKDTPRFFVALRQHFRHFEEWQIGGRNDRQRYVGIRVPGIPHLDAPTIKYPIRVDAKSLESEKPLSDILDEALRKAA